MAESFQKKSLGDFLTQAADKITQKAQQNIKQLRSDITLVGSTKQIQSSSKRQSITQTLSSDNYTNQFESHPSEQQSQADENKGSALEGSASKNANSSAVNKSEHANMNTSRIRQIQHEKQRVMEELKKIDHEIADLKGSAHEPHKNEKQFQKKIKISKDEDAQKNAQKLVKQLNKERKLLDKKRKKQQEKLLQQFQVEQQEKRKIREIEIEKVKEEKRLAIEKRMEEEKRRKQERKLIDAQSNQLLNQLKKEEKIEKEKDMVSSNLYQVEHKKRVLENKKKLDFSEIQEHNRRYREQKRTQMQARKQKEQQKRSLSKQNSEFQHRFYPKNRWMELIEETDLKKQEQQRKKSQFKKDQVQKRRKYGELVNNMFNAKNKAHLNQNSRQKKPQTPQELPKVPININKSQKRRTHDHKIFNKEQSLPVIRDNNHRMNMSKKSHLPPMKEDDPDRQEKERIQKMRQFEIRKQTQERLKKLENKVQKESSNNQRSRSMITIWDK